jgi:small-conductance mechanosensitive channel
MKDKAGILADHYQKTYELTFELWKLRSQTFLILLAVIATGTLLTFSPTETNPLLVLWIAKILEVKTDPGIQELSRSFPFGLLQTLLLVVVFYLVVTLYHRSLYVLRNYRYLAALERDIREQLEAPPQSVAFTREGSFYWSDHAFLQGAVKWCYIVLVGGLLFAFLGARIYQDFKTRTLTLAAVELVIALATSLFFLAYAGSSVTMDQEQSMLPARRPGAKKRPDAA